MASEIRVNKIINRSGLSTVTFSDTGAIVSGIVTANSFSGNLTGNVTGSGANLTSIPAGQLTGTVADARLSTVSSSKLSGALPALDGSALTGVGLGTEGSVNTSGIITATSFVPTVGQLSHRNLIVNGDMTVAQRATSYTGADPFTTVDRYRLNHTGLNEDCTTAQADVASGTAPYTNGFRKSFKVTNGNHTAGAGAGDRIAIQYRLEAQDVANSGWNYVSSSSNITLQFWVKSSVAQNFFGTLKTSDGTSQNYPFETGSLSADTWTKITKTIPGNSNLQFDNNNEQGLQIEFTLFRGTDQTGSVTLNQWAAFNSSTHTPDNTSTWYTTNDATFEITGLQLEVGPVATPFEHLSFAENKRRCYRYCQRGRHMSSCLVGTPGTYYFSRGNIPLFTPMRATVTGTLKQATWNNNRYFGYKTWSSETNVTAAPASTTFASGNITGVPDILSVQLHISISSGSSNSPLPANGPGSNNVYPIEYYDVLLEAEL